MNYYRGQNPTQYKLNNLNSQGFVVSMMDAKSQIVLVNGQSAASIATYDQKTYSIWVQTNSEDVIGPMQVIVRNCDSLDRILELNLYIMILSNTHPDFSSTVQTAFQMSVGDVYSYKMPGVVDPENNDKPVVYIGKMDGNEDKYPPFLLYENITQTITFRPISEFAAGQTYYFTIVVKETNSDSVKYVYYCTLKMNGTILVKNMTINYTDVNYTINWFSNHSTGSMKMNVPINMVWMKANFYKMFKIYWRATTYRDD